MQPIVEECERQGVRRPDRPGRPRVVSPGVLVVADRPAIVAFCVDDLNDRNGGRRRQGSPRPRRRSTGHRETRSGYRAVRSSVGSSDAGGAGGAGGARRVVIEPSRVDTLRRPLLFTSRSRLRIGRPVGRLPKSPLTLLNNRTVPDSTPTIQIPSFRIVASACPVGDQSPDHAPANASRGLPPASATVQRSRAEGQEREHLTPDRIHCQPTPRRRPLGRARPAHEQPRAPARFAKHVHACHLVGTRCPVEGDPAAIR